MLCATIQFSSLLIHKPVRVTALKFWGILGRKTGLNCLIFKICPTIVLTSPEVPILLRIVAQLVKGWGLIEKIFGPTYFPWYFTILDNESHIPIFQQIWKSLRINVSHEDSKVGMTPLKNATPIWTALFLRCSFNGNEQRFISRKLRFGNCTYAMWSRQTVAATFVRFFYSYYSLEIMVQR